MKRPRKDRKRQSHENRLTWLTIGAAGPAIVIALGILWFGDYSAKLQWTFAIIMIGCLAGFIVSAREHIVRPLSTRATGFMESSPRGFMRTENHDSKPMANCKKTRQTAQSLANENQRYSRKKQTASTPKELFTDDYTRIMST